ncbi:unnamed protein product [Fusarium equiseti]|uniref:Uncharacterized protein n=1 Tax=Fusarium equiseti TaxID=61235 RepID=A0A8J2IZT5_FUSEQ|nr:unnamed protein product [Fusarium equiseti]
MAENETDAIARGRDRLDTTVVEMAAPEAGADDATIVVIDTIATMIATIESEIPVATIERIVAVEAGAVMTETGMTVDAAAPEAAAVMAELGMPVPDETEGTKPSLPLAREKTVPV